MKKKRKVIFIRIKGVVERTGMPESSIYAAMARGEFPRSVPLGLRARAWRSTDIDEWMEKCRKQGWTKSG